MYFFLIGVIFLDIRRVKKKGKKDVSFTSEDSKRIPGVKFYSLQDFVKAERIFDEVSRGNLVFLNIERISNVPERKFEFLNSLKQYSSRINATIKMVSSETLMVAPETVSIEIRTLSSQLDVDQEEEF